MLSVIIPVYKTPRTSLERCLNSVLALQCELEVVCILDSPGDPCGAILEEFALRDDRVRLLTNESNMGVSFSRNRGMDSAKGDVITFVDADDQIVPNAYEKGLEHMTQHDLDMCVCMSPNGGSWHGIAYGESVEASFPDGDAGKRTAIVTALGQSCWGVLWRRETIDRNRACFNEDLRYNEDFLFSTRLINGGGRFGMLNADGYHRIGCGQSVTKRAGTAAMTLNRLDAQCEMLAIINVDNIPPALRAWYAGNFLGNVFGDRHVSRLFTKVEQQAFDIRLKQFLNLFYAKDWQVYCSLPARLLLGKLRRRPHLLLSSYWTMALPMAALLKFDIMVSRLPETSDCP